tara:strand:- start:614 stop:829 length:216 start_codon:yes stop_codon:yes gene_type:complete
MDKIQCPMCDNDFLPDDGTYEIGDEHNKYCSEKCLYEEQLIQEEHHRSQIEYWRPEYGQILHTGNITDSSI